jgi:hypothetical protein
MIVLRAPALRLSRVLALAPGSAAQIRPAMIVLRAPALRLSRVLALAPGSAAQIRPAMIASGIKTFLPLGLAHAPRKCFTL